MPERNDVFNQKANRNKSSILGNSDMINKQTSGEMGVNANKLILTGSS